MINRGFLSLIIILAALGSALFSIYYFVPFPSLDKFAGLATFIIVVILLIPIYMVGLIVLGFFIPFLMPKLIRRKQNKQPQQPKTGQ